MDMILGIGIGGIAAIVVMLLGRFTRSCTTVSETETVSVGPEIVITKMGVLPEKRLNSLTCGKCCSIMEYTLESPGVIREVVRGVDWAHLKCPVCGHLNWIHGYDPRMQDLGL